MNNELLIFPCTSISEYEYLYVSCEYFHMFGMVS